MSFPQYQNIIDEAKKNDEIRNNNDIMYINKVLKEYYIKTLEKNINDSKYSIASYGYMNNIVIRREDLDNIYDKQMLCEKMNDFLKKNGFKFKTKLEYNSINSASCLFKKKY